MYDAILFLAEGFEEIEAVATLDILRRGGVNAASVSITSTREVTGAHNITVKADMTFEEMPEILAQGNSNEGVSGDSIAAASDNLGTPGNFDNLRNTMLILPGGAGRVNFEKHPHLPELLKAHNAQGGKIAAICGAPTILGGLGILANKTAVCFPAVTDRLKSAKIGQESTVTDGNITTSKAAGTTFSFALEILRLLKGEETAAKVAESGLFQHA